MKIEAKREDWKIEIRDDNRDGRSDLIFYSEYAARKPNGDRMIVQGLPEVSSALIDTSSIPIVLRDGHQTTADVIIDALRELHKVTIDQHELDLQEDANAEAEDVAALQKIDADIKEHHGGNATEAHSRAVAEIRDRQDARARRQHRIHDKLHRHHRRNKQK